jgi:hypothetical protein
MKAFKKSLGMTGNGHDDDEDVAKAVGPALLIPVHLRALYPCLHMAMNHASPPQIKPGPIDQAFVRELEDAERRGHPQDLLGFCRHMSRHRGHAELQGRACKCLSSSGVSVMSPR